mmetsp:Transcript_80180/g.232814  ORF Transcript_80180/g.232814 Transcript_80180/m.232814 type:complete len:245 (-) Transcript_80180:400-1134(-)
MPLATCSAEKTLMPTQAPSLFRITFTRKLSLLVSISPVLKSHVTSGPASTSSETTSRSGWSITLAMHRYVSLHPPLTPLESGKPPAAIKVSHVCGSDSGISSAATRKVASPRGLRSRTLASCWMVMSMAQPFDICALDNKAVPNTSSWCGAVFSFTVNMTTSPSVKPYTSSTWSQTGLKGSSLSGVRHFNFGLPTTSIVTYVPADDLATVRCSWVRSRIAPRTRSRRAPSPGATRHGVLLEGRW